MLEGQNEVARNIGEEINRNEEHERVNVGDGRNVNEQQETGEEMYEIKLYN